jgi:hypothetical protein
LPWAIADVDPDKVLAEVGRQFPGVMTYFGEFTGSWWALIGGKLLEARTPREFVEVIGTAIGSSVLAAPEEPERGAAAPWPGRAPRAGRHGHRRQRRWERIICALVRVFHRRTTGEAAACRVCDSEGPTPHG